MSLDSADSPLDIQSRWAFEVLTAPELPSDESMAGRFVPVFLDRHPQGFAATLEEWRKKGPFVLLDYQLVGHKGWLTLAGPNGERYVLTVIVDSNALIRVLTLQAEIVVPEVHIWADVDEALLSPGVTYSVLAARIEQGRTELLHSTAADRAMPTGSAYKLYVMRALVAAIENGELSWDDHVTVRPGLRSLPTGDMQELPDGTQVTVRETAHKMIAMSDNTAADLIADRLGRDALERTVVDSGHHDPSLLRPFLLSNEVFQIGWGDPAVLKAWAEGDESARRQLLKDIEGPISVRISDLGETVHHLGVDWRMSASDVLEVLVELVRDSRRDTTGTVESILTAYPGIPIDREKWAKAFFKGGSCPGVMMFCWLLEDHEGVQHVLILQQAAAEQKLIGDGQYLRGLGARVIDSGLLRGGPGLAL